MPSPLPQQALARRALVEPARPRPTWFKQGAAAAGISVLGLAVAGSVAVSGTAQDSGPQLGAAADALALPAVVSQADRSAAVTVAPETLASPALLRADQRADKRTSADVRSRRATLDQALRVRTESLRSAAEAAEQRAAAVEHARAKRAAHAQSARRAALKRAAARRAARAAAAEAKQDAAREAAHRAVEHRRTKRQTIVSPASPASPAGHAGHGGHASLPITSGYRMAARFGQTGVWSRYHTGLDFAAPQGTTIRAVLDGVVTHAGSGSAGWAGRYVTIRHADGKTTLYAHMSSVTVHPGEHVSGGQRIGSVGMTGRTFGPHVHVELYPRGVRPGKVYSAINPAPWMRAHGLHV